MAKSGAHVQNLAEAEQRAVEYGIDLSLLEENLRLTPAERMLQHDEALFCMEQLRKAWTTKHESPARAA